MPENESEIIICNLFEMQPKLTKFKNVTPKSKYSKVQQRINTSIQIKLFEYLLIFCYYSYFYFKLIVLLQNISILVLHFKIMFFYVAFPKKLRIMASLLFSDIQHVSLFI